MNRFFLGVIKHSTALLLIKVFGVICVTFLSNDPTPIVTRRGNASNMHNHVTTQHPVNVHKCNIFDMLLSDVGNSQSRAGESTMRIDKRIDKKSNR